MATARLFVGAVMFSSLQVLSPAAPDRTWQNVDYYQDSFAKDQGPGGDPIAAIVADLGTHPFGLAMADWERSAPGLVWQRHRGALGSRNPSDLWATATNWCALGHDFIPGARREALFYPFRSERPLACRLEQLRYTVAAGADPETTYRAHARSLEAVFGKPSIDGMSEDISQFGTRQLALYPKLWGVLDQPLRFARRWHTPGAMMFLFVDDAGVQFVARSNLLLEWGVGRRPSGVWSRFGHSRAVWEVANAVRAQSPEAASLILTSNPVGDQAMVSRTATALLERSKTRSGDERSILQLTASLVLDLFVVDDRGVEDRLIQLPRRPDVDRLVTLGVRFDYNPHAGVWRPDSGLWDGVIRNRPGSWWGQLAFVERLEGGWNRECGDDYKDVIREGKAWLQKYPRSPFSVRVTFDIAEAYEAWWSLGQAPEGEEEMVVADEHRIGSREARVNAIRWYERLRRETPDTYEAEEALGSYIRLLENIDTGSRRFLCRIA